MTSRTKHSGSLWAAIGIGVVGIGVGVAHAEVSVDGFGTSVTTLVLAGVVDDPLPIGIWFQYRPVAADQVLNADGHARGDGRPDIVWRDNAWPVVTWAYNAGGDFDIAFSEWDGTQWTATAFLTASTDDERDPRLFVESDGTTHVVWWTAGTTERVHLSTRQAGSSTWGLPVLVTAGAETGRRPAVAVFDGKLSVGYERDAISPGMAQDIVVATLQAGGGFTLEIVGATGRPEALDVMLHAEQGHLWADWKHEASELGCAEHQPGVGWNGNAPAPWTDPSWVGIEEARKAIRSQVLE